MKRVTLTMAEPMAQRLEAAARFSGFTPENLALAAVALAVARIESGDGLTLPVAVGEVNRLTGLALPAAPDEEL